MRSLDADVASDCPMPTTIAAAIARARTVVPVLYELSVYTQASPDRNPNGHGCVLGKLLKPTLQFGLDIRWHRSGHEPSFVCPAYWCFVYEVVLRREYIAEYASSSPVLNIFPLAEMSPASTPLAAEAFHFCFIIRHVSLLRNFTSSEIKQRPEIMFYLWRNENTYERTYIPQRNLASFSSM